MYDDDTLTGLDKPGRARQHRSGGSLSSRGAIFHLSVRTGSRSKGQSARAAAAYIQRDAEYGRSRDEADELLYAESGHMPSWAEAEPTSYWDAADLHERANGRLFKRLEFALPLALSAAEQQELAVGFARHLTADEHLPYTLAIHAGHGTNPHCHLLISERTNDGLERSPEQWFSRYNAAAPEQGGARKTEALKPRAWLDATREALAEQTNQALERAGHEVRIDHRSYAEQGIERLPGVHLGPTVAAMEARGIETERGAEARRRVQVNAELAALTIQREELDYERTPTPVAERDRGDPRLAAGRDREADGLGESAAGVGGPARGLGSGDLGDADRRLGAGRSEGRGAVADRGPEVGADPRAVGGAGADPVQPSLGRGRARRESDRGPDGPDQAAGTPARAVVSEVEPGPVAGAGSDRARDPTRDDAVSVARSTGPGTGEARGGPSALSPGLERPDGDGAEAGREAPTGAERGPVAAATPSGPAEAETAEQARQREAAVEQAAARARAQLAATRAAHQAAREKLAATREARQREREQEQERQQERERQRGRGRDEDFDLER